MELPRTCIRHKRKGKIVRVIGWKALRSLRCLPILLILSATPLYSATEEAWEMLESEHFQVYYQPNATQPQDIIDIAEDF